jgi:hypothetical protein
MKTPREIKENKINNITKISFEKLAVLTDSQIDEMFNDLLLNEEE